MIKFPNTLAFKLTFWYSIAFVVFIALALFTSYYSIQSVLDDRMDEDLHEDVEEFGILFAEEGLSSVKTGIGREVASDDTGVIFIRLIDFQGREIYSSDLRDWEGLSADQEILERFVDGNTEPILETISLSTQESETRVVYGLIGPDTILHLGESVEEIDEIMELLLIVFIIMFLLVMPVASLLGWFMAKRAVSGIEAVSKAAIDIEQGELDRRVTVKVYEDEIQRLVDTFNSMAERIRTLILEMREMIDNIAHDLRSPLARIRVLSETLLTGTSSEADYRRTAEDTIGECDRLIRLINNTLDVAEIEAGVSSNIREEVKVSELIEDACELFEPLAEEKQIDLSCDLVSDYKLYGDKQNLQRMLTNVLDNALKYTPSEGSVDIKLEGNEQKLDIKVSDTGIGIPKADQDRIFERFFRCDQSRGEQGCGLGLSFARAVARSHDGDISIMSMPAKGSTFTISFRL